MNDQETQAVERALTSLGWQGERPKEAVGFVERLVGYLGCRRGCGAVVPSSRVFWHCRAVHTCFMQVPVDVVFARRDGVVLRLYRRVKPWRFLSCGNADFVIERLADGG